VGVADASQCGRVSFTDLHVDVGVGEAGGDDSDPTKPFPTGCADTPWSPQGLAMAFAILDAFSCIEDPSAAPTVPALR
jgi:hypothetical protein